MCTGLEEQDDQTTRVHHTHSLHNQMGQRLMNLLQFCKNRTRYVIEDFKLNHFSSFFLQTVNPALYGLKKFGGGNRRGGGRGYGHQHGTFKKGSFGPRTGGYGGGGARGGFENGGGYKPKTFDSYGGSSSTTSRFSDRKFEGGEASRSNGHTFANGHTRFN